MADTPNPFRETTRSLAGAALSVQRSWLELYDLIFEIESYFEGRTITDNDGRVTLEYRLASRSVLVGHKVNALFKRALDLEYDLTGDCAIVGPLADQIGTLPQPKRKQRP